MSNHTQTLGPTRFNEIDLLGFECVIHYISSEFCDTLEYQFGRIQDFLQVYK